jgi:hypothetical protein
MYGIWRCKRVCVNLCTTVFVCLCGLSGHSVFQGVRACICTNMCACVCACLSVCMSINKPCPVSVCLFAFCESVSVSVFFCACVLVCLCEPLRFQGLFVAGGCGNGRSRCQVGGEQRHLPQRVPVLRSHQPGSATEEGQPKTAPPLPRSQGKASPLRPPWSRGLHPTGMGVRTAPPLNMPVHEETPLKGGSRA